MGAAVMPEIAPNGNAPHLLCTKLKNKAIEISNKFRSTFGLPLIEAPGPVFIHAPASPLIPIPYAAPAPKGGLHILPIGPPSFVQHPPFNPHPSVEEWANRRKGVGRGGCHRSFVHRVHRALTILGPWEGRAVAFVLGESSAFCDNVHRN